MESLNDVSMHFLETNKLCEEHEFKDAVSICSHFHFSVQELSDAYYEEVRRRNYVTPTNFL
jgi:dynein heavy chain